ncbi:MAG TPA: heavy metal-associated domain-containing protein [Rhodocyclaceae bacterium]|nr:heavy-metal-associated domain-containing protein [Zoogloeaceae bacterium]HRD34134.1 heavy metal-associated domain-containing protein [Rhodocyclaceae bacterium]
MAMCEFKVVGMQDEQCLRLVMNAIQDLPGIGYVEVSLETGDACVEHGAFISEGDVRAAVEDAGFTTR